MTEKQGVTKMTCFGDMVRVTDATPRGEKPPCHTCPERRACFDIAKVRVWQDRRRG